MGSSFLFSNTFIFWNTILAGQYALTFIFWVKVVEKWKRELQEDNKNSYMNAITTALMKDIITVDQCKEIMDLQAKYFDILRNYKKGA